MKKTIYIFVSLFIAFFIANTCSAQLLNSNALNGLTKNSDAVRVSSGLSGTASVGSVISSVISTGLALLAAIFLVLMVFSGFQWMTASGNESQISKAQDTIKAALIGLIVVLAAYAITYFVFKYLPFTASTTGSGNDGKTILSGEKKN